MSVIIQMCNGDKQPRAICLAKDLPLNKLILSTITVVNRWATTNAFQPDETKRMPFEYLNMVEMDDFGGMLTRQRNVTAIYQINYDEDLKNNTLKIKNFIYANLDCQCKVFGDVYGYAIYKHIDADVKPTHPEVFYNFNPAKDEHGNLIYPKQYNISLELDEVDKQQLEKERQEREAADKAKNADAPAEEADFKAE